MKHPLDLHRSRRPYSAQRRWDGNWRGAARGWRAGRNELATMLLAALVGGAAWTMLPDAGSLHQESHAARPVDTAGTATVGGAASRIKFGICHGGGGRDCVVDGDTFWMAGVKIRIADIDTPETHPARCAQEAERGAAATERLHALLNGGRVELSDVGRDADRYGRKLRIVSVDGQGVGDTLIAEGLARPYDGGRRAGWCD